eukprot:COSAG01_NODE_434_length_17079_cov_11.829270_6_plen_346_part_00
MYCKCPSCGCCLGSVHAASVLTADHFSTIRAGTSRCRQVISEKDRQLQQALAAQKELQEEVLRTRSAAARWTDPAAQQQAAAAAAAAAWSVGDDDDDPALQQRRELLELATASVAGGGAAEEGRGRRASGEQRGSMSAAAPSGPELDTAQDSSGRRRLLTGRPGQSEMGRWQPPAAADASTGRGRRVAAGVAAEEPDRRGQAAHGDAAARRPPPPPPPSGLATLSEGEDGVGLQHHSRHAPSCAPCGVGAIARAPTIAQQLAAAGAAAAYDAWVQEQWRSYGLPEGHLSSSGLVGARCRPAEMDNHPHSCHPLPPVLRVRGRSCHRCLAVANEHGSLQIVTATSS